MFPSFGSSSRRRPSLGGVVRPDNNPFREQPADMTQSDLARALSRATGDRVQAREIPGPSMYSNPRYQWQKAEAYVFAKLRAGSHPVLLHEVAEECCVQYSGQPELEYYASISRILTNLQIAGHFNDLPDPREYSKAQRNPYKRARLGLMMADRYGDFETLAKMAVDDEISRRLAQSRALDKQAEAELRQMREKEWKEAEDIYQANERALREEIAEIRALEATRSNLGPPNLRFADQVSPASSPPSRISSAGGVKIHIQKGDARNPYPMPPGYYGAQTAFGVEQLFDFGHRDEMVESKQQSISSKDRSRDRSQSRASAASLRTDHLSNIRGYPHNPAGYSTEAQAGSIPGQSRSQFSRPEYKIPQRAPLRAKNLSSHNRTNERRHSDAGKAREPVVQFPDLPSYAQHNEMKNQGPPSPATRDYVQKIAENPTHYWVASSNTIRGQVSSAYTGTSTGDPTWSAYSGSQIRGRRYGQAGAHYDPRYACDGYEYGNSRETGNRRPSAYGPNDYTGFRR